MIGGKGRRLNTNTNMFFTLVDSLCVKLCSSGRLGDFQEQIKSRAPLGTRGLKMKPRS